MKAKNKNYILFYNIKWDTDEQKVKLPKKVKVKATEFAKDFDIAMEGADYLSDNFGWCVFSFSFKKTA